MTATTTLASNFDSSLFSEQSDSAQSGNETKVTSVLRNSGVFCIQNPQLLDRIDTGTHKIFLLQASFENEEGDKVAINPISVRIRNRTSSGDDALELSMALKLIEGIAHQFKGHSKEQADRFFAENRGVAFRFHFDDDVPSVFEAKSQVQRVWYFRPETAFGRFKYAFGNSERVRNDLGTFPFYEVDQAAQAAFINLAREVDKLELNPRLGNEEEEDSSEDSQHYFSGPSDVEQQEYVTFGQNNEEYVAFGQTSLDCDGESEKFAEETQGRDDYSQKKNTNDRNPSGKRRQRNKAKLEKDNVNSLVEDGKMPKQRAANGTTTTYFPDAFQGSKNIVTGSG